MNTRKLERELAQLLVANPQLLDLQLEIDAALEGFKTPESRLYYLSIEMMDKVDELTSALNELELLNNELKANHG